MTELLNFMQINISDGKLFYLQNLYHRKYWTFDILLIIILRFKICYKCIKIRS